MNRALLVLLGLLALAGCGNPPSIDTLPVAPTPTPVTVTAPATTPLVDPTTVEIPALGVVDELDPVGLAADGSMAIPPVDVVGWYELGVPLGAPGPAVLAGHVNYEGTAGAFERLADLKVGDDIVVTDVDGRRLTFDVYEIRQFPKSAFDYRFVFGSRPAAELVAVTCSGDVVDRSYTDNTAVVARLVVP